MLMMSGGPPIDDLEPRTRRIGHVQLRRPESSEHGSGTANLTGLPTNITQYSYDNASNLGSVVYPNGVTTQFTYDTLNRVMSASSQVSSGSTSGQVSSYTYQRGPTGNLSQVVELGGRQVNWSYDDIYRLTNETIAGDPSNNGSASYSLDPVGNRTSVNSSFNGFTPIVRHV